MGLAASQARLLSITSRISDNELRSQLINNAKMRLTSDSARVSDEYVAALNATQLMFTNFDTQGNEMYQALTFNSLTAYSSYNTQYGIVNNSGELLVSASDADKFEAAGGSLEKFLNSYGLEQTTDYFSTLAKSKEFIANGVGWYDDYGNWQKFDVSVDELQAMYEGITDANGKIHYNKTDSLNSLEYGQYQSLVSTYRGARDNYNNKLKTAMKKFLGGTAGIIPGNTFQVYSQTFDTYFASVRSDYDKFDPDHPSSTFNENTAEKYVNIFKAFAAKVGLNEDMTLNQNANISEQILIDFYSMGGKNDAFLEILRLNLKIASSEPGKEIILESKYFGAPNGATKLATYDEQDNFIGYVNGTEKYLVKASEGETGAKYYSGFGYGKIEGTEPTDPNIEYVKVIDYGSLEEEYSYETAYKYTDESGVERYTHRKAEDFEELNKSGKLSLCNGVAMVYDITAKINEEDIMNAIKILFETFKNNIMDNISHKPFEQKEEIKNARADYEKAAEKLADFIYGEGNGQKIVAQMGINDYRDINMIDYLDQPSWVLSQEFKETINGCSKLDFTHFNPFNKDYQTTFLTEGTTSGNNYQVVKDLFLLDCLFEHYGDPVYTWIDKDDKNENSQAKATWYSNLFARMQQGYKVIGEGLRNNQEWLQFAFESGFVHMEQVNKSSEWVSTLYSNCSTITESTINANITLAEAKYNREMAKIEAKDKKYDIELKNIDTEHESLKTEYDSIKKVIDNNIKSNMKLFQNG